jgi:hypothetical protein
VIPTRLLEFRVDFVVFWTEIQPILRSDLSLRTGHIVLWALSEYDGETSFKMPVDVAIFRFQSVFARNKVGRKYLPVQEP